MTDTESTGSAALLGALRTTHRSVVGLLLVCAAVIATQGLGGDAAPPDRRVATGAVAIGLAAIALRRIGSSPVISVRSAVLLTLAGLVSAGGLGALGVYVATTQGGAQTGLLLTAAGLIFALRPPAVKTD